MPNFQLTERVAVVTGASRGLGSAIAEGLAEQGARVVLSSRKQDDLDREAARLNARFPESAVAIAAHAGRQDDLRNLVDRTMERFGRIDILVNNAGTNPYFGPLIDADPAVWDKTFEVNLRGYFLLTQLVYRAWMEQHGGAVLNIASTGGLRPSIGLGVYDVTNVTSPSLVYQKPTSNTIAGLAHFTAGGQPYLAYETLGGTSLSICQLQNGL